MLDPSFIFIRHVGRVRFCFVPERGMRLRMGAATGEALLLAFNCSLVALVRVHMHSENNKSEDSNAMPGREPEGMNAMSEATYSSRESRKEQ